MQGIPVRANGDPVTLTLVYAGCYEQFAYWCMYSHVSTLSKMVRYLSDARIAGYRDFDLVYTGSSKPWRDADQIGQALRYYELTGAILKTWDQPEAYLIEPDVVD